MKENPGFAAPFYKKSLEVLGERMHTANNKIEEETTILKNEISQMMKGNRPDERLIETQMTVNKTGVQMFDSLDALLPELDTLAAELPSNSDNFLKIKNKIQKVLAVDSQSFDMISQQIDITCIKRS